MQGFVPEDLAQFKTTILILLEATDGGLEGDTPYFKLCTKVKLY
jgi:hypothetical protein